MMRLSNPEERAVIEDALLESGRSLVGLCARRLLGDYNYSTQECGDGDSGCGNSGFTDSYGDGGSSYGCGDGGRGHGSYGDGGAVGGDGFSGNGVGDGSGYSDGYIRIVRGFE